jgi:hypothetical protein
MAEAEDLKSSQCGFDPHSGHYIMNFSSVKSQSVKVTL